MCASHPFAAGLQVYDLGEQAADLLLLSQSVLHLPGQLVRQVRHPLVHRGWTGARDGGREEIGTAKGQRGERQEGENESTERPTWNVTCSRVPHECLLSGHDDSLTELLHAHHHQLLLLLLVVGGLRRQIVGLGRNMVSSPPASIERLSPFTSSYRALSFERTSERSLWFSSSRPLSLCCRKS